MFKIERNGSIVREIVVHRTTGSWQHELEVRELSFTTMKKAEEIAKSIGGVVFEVVEEQELMAA